MYGNIIESRVGDLGGNGDRATGKSKGIHKKKEGYS